LKRFTVHNIGVGAGHFLGVRWIFAPMSPNLSKKFSHYKFSLTKKMKTFWRLHNTFFEEKKSNSDVFNQLVSLIEQIEQRCRMVRLHLLHPQLLNHWFMAIRRSSSFCGQEHVSIHCEVRSGP